MGEHLRGQAASPSEASSRPETAASSKRGVKRGRPKSERKKMDAELFKRLKADSSNELVVTTFSKSSLPNLRKFRLYRNLCILRLLCNKHVH